MTDNSKILKASDFSAMPRIPRMTLINSITGFKSGNLIGTINADGLTNLSVFSSAVHIGSDPAMIALVTRPIVDGGKTSRHTYDNIKNSGYFTINHIHEGIIKQSHQCSASYSDGVSEFDAVGFTAQYLPDFKAPFVAESRIKMGMSFVEEYFIKANNTVMLIGKVEHLIFPTDCVDEQGNLDLNLAETVAVSGLDSYHSAKLLERLAYARV
jgi:flavin reductase (DIM6/NTAB) family NADH-FMN oxidoreductase RutF